jgi:hypothetical protein
MLEELLLLLRRLLLQRGGDGSRAGQMKILAIPCSGVLSPCNLNRPELARRLFPVYMKTCGVQAYGVYATPVHATFCHIVDCT